MGLNQITARDLREGDKLVGDMFVRFTPAWDVTSVVRLDNYRVRVNLRNGGVDGKVIPAGRASFVYPLDERVETLTFD
jgi:hypothetical protein